jgi:hypothetical protein
MTNYTDDDKVTLAHPNSTLSLRERIGYLIYAWDDTIEGDRTRSQYLELADTILGEVDRGA